MLTPTIIKEGMRMFKRRRNISKYLHPYTGTDEQICRKIINNCYNKQRKYFQVSANINNNATNYLVFYARDFGWCAESLINLGYKKEVLNTLNYALEIYSNRNNKNGITVAINPQGKPFNFPDVYSPDSIAYFFRSLRIADAKDLILKYSDFLNREIERFEDIAIDKEKGIVSAKHFSGMRDYSIVKASCYDMIMACSLCNEIDKINKLIGKKILKNTLKKYNLKKNLIKYYWTGTHFKDAPDKNVLSGHCNIYPFFLDVIEDKKIMKSCINELIKNNFDKPFPLKYEHTDKNTSRKTKFLWHEFFVQDWEKDAIWAMLGMAYIDVVAKFDKKKAKEYLKLYREEIEHHGGFIEVYDAKGNPYQSWFYASENTMLWASMYLDMKKKLK